MKLTLAIPPPRGTSPCPPITPPDHQQSAYNQHLCGAEGDTASAIQIPNRSPCDAPDAAAQSLELGSQSKEGGGER